jgi:hypothetical protein
MHCLAILDKSRPNGEEGAKGRDKGNCLPGHTYLFERQKIDGIAGKSAHPAIGELGCFIVKKEYDGALFNQYFFHVTVETIAPMGVGFF